MNVVSVEQGELAGRVRTTSGGFRYVSHSGIPYAKPPVGELRFADPRPPDGWSGVRDATAEGEVFAQRDMYLGGGHAGSEDALFLNVYAPEGASPGELPVMVWIHGGAFHTGSGGRLVYGPDHLVERGVVVVTFNYRLGALGFLCLHTPEVPGNAGLKDQLLALEWVRDNVRPFGGDPDRVTLFGESAGAASVAHHLLSPASAGLFRGAIMQSGSCLNPWAVVEDPEETAFRFAERLGAGVDRDPRRLLEVLRSAPVEELTDLTGFELGKRYTFAPVVERRHGGAEPFLAEAPAEAVAAGRFASVPCVVGFNDQEGVLALFMGGWGRAPTEEEADAFLSGVLPSEGAKAAVKREYYSKEGGHVGGLTAAMSDWMFNWGIREWVRALVRRGSPTYYYQFCYHGAFNIFRHLCDFPYTGAAHGDDIAYVFKPDLERLRTLVKSRPAGAAPPPPPTDTDALVVGRFADMWSEFAKRGRPSDSWPAADSDGLHCLRISSSVSTTLDPVGERSEFWRRLRAQMG